MSDIVAPGSLPREVARVGLRAVADQRRPIVMVLGMHRSGTSLCSHVLSALGVEMTDDITAPGSGLLGPDNQKGHWERREIVQFHDRIFAYFDRLYASTAHDFSLPVAWWAEPRVTSIRREIVAYLQGRMQNAAFGLKDPRTVRLMPIWYQIFAELKLAPKIVYCLRDPVQVARSVHSRDGFSQQLAEYRWLAYNLEFFRYAKAYEFCTVEYESWFENPARNLTKLQEFLNLSSYQDDSGLELEVSQIVDHALRHDDHSIYKPHHPLVRSVYEMARRAEDDSAARNKLENIAVEFLSFQQLQGAFEGELQQKDALTLRLSGVEQEAKMLRAALEERDTRLKELETEAKMLRAELDERHTRLDELKNENTALRGARAADVVQLTERAVLAEQSLSAVRDVLAAAEREAEERVAAAASMRTDLAERRREISVLSNALSEAERAARTAEDRAADAKQSGEIAEHNVKVAERRANEAEQAARVAEDRARKAADEAADLRNKISTLATELTNARQVGRAAMQALLTTTSGNVDREHRLGWRQMVRRLFRIRGNQPQVLLASGN